MELRKQPGVRDATRQDEWLVNGERALWTRCPAYFTLLEMKECKEQGQDDTQGKDVM